MLAPIALFCFRRPDHLARVLTALAANHGARDHDLIAFADGPRDGGDSESVAAVHRQLADWAGRGAFRSFTIHASQANRGLRVSVVSGVSRVIADSGAAIVIEDDLETSPWFLQFCDDGLRLYADEPSAASIHGYCYPLGRPMPATFFLRGADCWGWATWRRAWAVYEDDAGTLLARLRSAGLVRAFNHDGARKLAGMLGDARDGRIDSWAVRWHAAAFLAGMFTLYPGRSLVRNIGLDTSGTHGDDEVDDSLAVTPATDRPTVDRILVGEDPQAWAALRDYFRRTHSMGSRIGRVLRRLGRRKAVGRRARV